MKGISFVLGRDWMDTKLFPQSIAVNNATPYVLHVVQKKKKKGQQNNESEVRIALAFSEDSGSIAGCVLQAVLQAGWTATLHSGFNNMILKASGGPEGRGERKEEEGEQEGNGEGAGVS